MANGSQTLIAKGVTQGCLLSCHSDHLTDYVKMIIMNGRAIEDKRTKPILEDHRLLVLTQNCDINNPQDPYIEVLVVKPLNQKRVSSLQQSNRNYRKLQLLVDNQYWLLEADLISIIPKDSLQSNALKVVTQLDERSHTIVIDWRVGRYQRKPFPHQFNLDFIAGYLRNPEHTLSEFLESHRDSILDLYVYVDPLNEEHAEEYRVSLTAPLSEDCPEELEAQIERELHHHLTVLHQQENTLKMMQVDPNYAPDNLEINQAITLKTSDFTFLDAVYLTRITLDFLCYN